MVSVKNILSGFPGPVDLKNRMKSILLPDFREANGHIHTPFSFSAFENVESIFEKAKNEDIKVLGINDFYVTDGFEEFNNGCLKSAIFPLFNIEFIGLMKKEQKEGIRINDPNNPGRIYFCGKGLDFPFHLETGKKKILDSVKEETQNQLKAMIEKLNILIKEIDPSMELDYIDIKQKYARELVRERHIAKALRILAAEKFPDPEKQKSFLESLFGGKKLKADLANSSALENEIRGNILKAGGTAFVEEEESSFLEIYTIKSIITDAGGIPCYPVLLDDPNGKCTEFEGDAQKLYESLKNMGVGCIELIPGRNDLTILEKFVEYFDSKGFIVTFGTEHNAPGMIPLAVSARGEETLGSRLKQTAWRGVCVIAAHQYLHAQNMEGYIDRNGQPKTGNKREFEQLGAIVIEYFLSTVKK